MRYLLCILCIISSLGAVVKHTPETIAAYRKYHRLVATAPENKRYLFEYAMVLAQMGRIELAGEQLKKIDTLDDNYAHKLVTVLEQEKNRNLNNWQLRFKLGFVYYFLYEEAQGRIDLANRRIKKAKENPQKFKPGTIASEKEVISERQPLANDYRLKALFNFRKVAEKKPLTTANAWGYAYMAVIKAIEKDWVAAQTLCEKALELEPDAYAIRAAYMEALKQNGNPLAAASQMSTALTLRSQQEAYERELLGNEY